MAEIQVNEMHPSTVRMPNGSLEVVNEVSTRYLTKQEIYEIKTAPDTTTEEYILANGEVVEVEPVAVVVEEVVVEAPVEEAPAEEAPVAEVPVEEAPVAEVTTEEPVAEEVVEETSEEVDDSSSHRKSRRK
jgi:hypothetical protein